MSPKTGGCEGMDVKPAGGCSLSELLHLLGKAHVLPLLYVLNTQPRPHRFVDLQRQLDLSPNTLSERLKELTEAGLVTRTVYNEIPPRVDYEATPKARELGAIFGDLVAWTQRHSLKAESPGAKATA